MLARPAPARPRPEDGHTWRAPGRVNLIGDHTDYQDGFCLPMAIDRECRITVTAATTAGIRARSAQLDGVVDVAPDATTDPAAVEPRWGRFLAGAVRAVCELGTASLPPADLAVSSTVPAGSGLSSSSALTVALTVAFAELAGVDVERTELARVALAAEVMATGVPGGLMDQLAALLAVPEHALLLDCRTLHADPIPIPRAVGVVVIHSGEPRALADSAYAERRAACEAVAARLGVASLRDATRQQVRDDPVARHVVTENARVVDFAAALRAGDVGALGPLMLASHASLRDDFAVSTPALDALVDACMEHGALGARLTGAGFGGCVVALVQRNHADDLLARVARAVRASSGHEPLGFSVRAGAAAGRVQ
jgi:galactokinase